MNLNNDLPSFVHSIKTRGSHQLQSVYQKLSSNILTIMSINIRDCHERKESKVDKRVYFLYERLDICHLSNRYLFAQRQHVLDLEFKIYAF